MAHYRYLDLAKPAGCRLVSRRLGGTTGKYRGSHRRGDRFSRLSSNGAEKGLGKMGCTGSDDSYLWIVPPARLHRRRDAVRSLTLAILLASLFGLLFGLIYLRTGSLWLPVALHFTWNFIENDLLNLSADFTNPNLVGAMTRLQRSSHDDRNQLGERGRFGITGICDDCVRGMAVVEE